MELIFPTIEHKQAARDYRQEHFDHGETVIHGDGGLDTAESYEAWLDKVTRDLDGSAGRVPATLFFAIVDGKIVGTIQIRHSLNFNRGDMNGHIGYGIRPSERRKGYASQMLALALDRCRELDIDKALVSCDKSNIGSAKTILKNGGILENEIVEDDGHVLQRYWITIRGRQVDLHDFADVAMNYDCFLPEVTKGSYYLDGFEEFHRRLAGEYGKDGILDIACGTGALTLPLAKAGYDVTALDLSAPMVEITREKLQKENLHADLLVANMTDFKILRTFSLAIIARSGFMHLTTAEEQRKTLLNIREHLVDGGVLTFNHFQPYPVIQAEQMKAKPDEYFIRSEYINHCGQRERIFNAFTYDHITQVQRGSWKFETLDNSRNVIDTRVRPVAMRHTYRQEMEYLFELCGYEILNVYNNYHRDKARDNFIWVVKKS